MALEAGYDMHIAKPLDVAQLLTTIAKVLPLNRSIRPSV
jgi:hypothetical protein